MPITTPEQLARVAYSVYSHVANRKKPTAIDRQKMVLGEILGRNKMQASATGGVWKWKLKHDDGGAMQFWQRKDVLAFTEPEFQLEMSYSFVNMHQGREFTHEDLFELGYDVKPNGPRGKNFASGASDSDAERLVDWFDEAIESLMDKFDVEEDKILHRDGAYDSKSLVGLDGILPISNPTSGTIGGVSRSNPLVRHYVTTGLTTTASGTLPTGLTTARRTCLLNGRGHNLGGGLVIVAGSAFVDGYRAYAKANGIEYHWDPTKVLNGLDIGIPEASFQFEGLPIVWDPTMDYLDTIESPTIPWAKRAYMLAPKTWKYVIGNKMDKTFSAPLDKAEQRVTRLSLDSRLSLGNICPNANAVLSIA